MKTLGQIAWEAHWKQPGKKLAMDWKKTAYHSQWERVAAAVEAAVIRRSFMHAKWKVKPGKKP